MRRDGLRGDDEALWRSAQVADRPARGERQRRVIGVEERGGIRFDHSLRDHDPHIAICAGLRHYRVTDLNRAEPREMTITMRGDDGVAGLPRICAARKMPGTRIQGISADAFENDLVKALNFALAAWYYRHNLTSRRLLSHAHSLPEF